MVHKVTLISWRAPWGATPVALVHGRIAGIALDGNAVVLRAATERRILRCAPLRVAGPLRTAAAAHAMLDASLQRSLSARELLAACDLRGLTDIDLHFPKFTDGRAYSQAFLLRRRRGFSGEIRATGDVLVDQLAQMERSGFDVAVLRALARVPHGATATYGEIAAAIGSPRAARAVGGALGRNPFPVLLPCHRVVSAAGIGGYGGAAGSRWRPGGEAPLDFKRRLLQREGVSAA